MTTGYYGCTLATLDIVIDISECNFISRDTDFMTDFILIFIFLYFIFFLFLLSCFYSCSDYTFYIS